MKKFDFNSKDCFIMIQKEQTTYFNLSYNTYELFDFDLPLEKMLEKYFQIKSLYNDRDLEELWFYHFYLLNPKENLCLKIDEFILKPEVYINSDKDLTNLSTILNLYANGLSENELKPFIEEYEFCSYNYDYWNINRILNCFNEEFLKEIKEKKIKFIIQKD